MLQFVSYDVVFQEVPNEVTLAINISGCPNKCKGCHSPHLQENHGQELDCGVLASLLARYQRSVTCVCFMGGDSDPKTVDELAAFVRKTTSNQVKTAWYSGQNQFSKDVSLSHFNYIKLGPYIEQLGGLGSIRTNQRFFMIDNNTIIDCTNFFAKKMNESPFSFA
jgi:anaerobic ribonucleoside-triphosphate reductase activating protein